MKNLIGSHIGQHEITEQLGRGGMANVYKAYHPGLAVYRAVKVIRPDLADTKGFQDRFQREARAVAALRHPNIVQIHDFGQQDDLFYMIMEFVEGEDLKTRMLREGAIRPFSEAVRLVEQIAGALGYAHKQGVVHRDVKPDNVLLTKDGQAILADFGIAKIIAADDAKLTATGTGLGTPAYMAPEQAKGATDVGEMADLYAVGVVLYEMLTAHLPFDADTPLAVLQRVIYDPVTPPREFTADIPDALQGVVLKAMAREPAHRYPSAAALVEAAKQSLAGGEGGMGSMIPPPPTLRRLPPTAAVTDGGTMIMDRSQAGTDSADALDSADSGVTLPASQAGKTRSKGPLIAAIVVMAMLLLAGAGVVAGGWWWFSSRGADVAEQDDLKAFFDSSGAVGQSFAADGTDDRSGDESSASGPDPAEGSAIEDPGAVGVTTSQAPTRASNSSESTGSGPAGSQGGGSRAATGTASQSPSSQATTQEAAKRPNVPAQEGESQDQSWRQRRTAGRGSSATQAAASPSDSTAHYLGEMRFGRAAYGEVEPGEPVEYSIEVKRPTTFYFDIITANRRATYTLLAPDGSRIFREEGSDVGPLTLEQSGTYTLRVETDGGIPIQFEVQLKQIGS